MKNIKKLMVAIGVTTAVLAAGGLLAACGGKEPEAEAHEHTYGVWSVTTEPTCLEDGVETRTCSTCEEGTEGHTQTQKVNAKGHSYGEWTLTTQPTCGKKGVDTRTCSVCDEETEGHTQTRDSSASLPSHTYGKWEVETEPTLESAGALVRICSVCEEGDSGHVARYAIPALNDEDYEYEVVNEEPTCLEPELYTYTFDMGLDANGEEVKFVFEVTGEPAKGHRYGLWYIGTKPTLETGGYAYRYCIGCYGQEGSRQQYDLPALNDVDYTVTISRKPTCVDEGEASYHYPGLGIQDSTTGRSWSGTAPIPATGEHDYGWVVSQTPTATAGGAIDWVCKVCKATEEGGSKSYELEALTKENVGEDKCYSYEGTWADCETDGDGTFTTQIEELGENQFTFKLQVNKLGHDIRSVKGDGYMTIGCTREGCPLAGEQMPYDNEVTGGYQIAAAAAGAIGNLRTAAKNAKALTLNKTTLVSSTVASTAYIQFFKFTMSSAYSSYTITFTDCDSTRTFAPLTTNYFAFFAATTSATPQEIGMVNPATGAIMATGAYAFSGVYENGVLKSITFKPTNTQKTATVSFVVLIDGSTADPHYVLMNVSAT